jgi:hypothetical protein
MRIARRGNGARVGRGGFATSAISTDLWRLESSSFGKADPFTVNRFSTLNGTAFE